MARSIKNKKTARKSRKNGGTKRSRSRSSSRNRAPPKRPTKKDDKLGDAQYYVDTLKPQYTTEDVIITMLDEDPSLFDDMQIVINDKYSDDEKLKLQFIKLKKLFDYGASDHHNETKIIEILTDFLEKNFFYFLKVYEDRQFEIHDKQMRLDADDRIPELDESPTRIEPMPTEDIKKNLIYLNYIVKH